MVSSEYSGRSHDRAAAAVAVDHVLAETFARKHFRSAGLEGMLHEADPVEVQWRESAPHLVEPVLGLHDDFVEAVRQPPPFLLFGDPPKIPLPTPVGARPANPLI